MRMKNLLFLLSIICSLHSFSQNGLAAPSTLNVSGVATVSVKPDLGILMISVSEIKQDMASAVSGLGIKSDYYINLFRKLGFNEKDLKTTDFIVARNRVYRNDETIDSGYIASQNIKLQFVYSQQLLQKILAEFSTSSVPVDFSFDFELSEELKKSVQTRIIEIAVKDGQEKAQLMANACGRKLGKIVNMSYGQWMGDGGMQQLERRDSHDLKYSVSHAVQSFNFTPDDLVFRDSVHFEYNIE